MSATIIDAQGIRRLATPHEEAQLEADRRAQEIRNLRESLAAIADCRAMQREKKEAKKKGLTPTHTRSTYGWRMRERRGSLGRSVPANLSGPIEGVNYAPPGESTLYEFQPRFRFSNDQVYEVWAVSKTNNQETARMLKTGFKRSCEDGDCHKSTCAMCWAVEFAKIEKSERIKILWRETPETAKVADPSGVHPKGQQNSEAQSLGEDQKAMFSLSSTIYSHKKGASNWR